MMTIGKASVDVAGEYVQLTIELEHPSEPGATYTAEVMFGSDAADTLAGELLFYASVARARRRALAGEPSPEVPA